MSPASAGVVSDLVVGVDDPEAGRVDVGVQQRVGHPGEHGQVVLQDVVLLNSILKEEGKSLDTVCNILLNQKVHDIVECASSVVGVVNGIASDIAGVHVSSDVEVDRIPLTRKSIECSTFYANLPSNPESLSNTRQLSVADSCFHQPLVLVLGTDEKTF